MATRSMFFNYMSDSACPYHRLLLPMRHCAEEMAKKDWTFHVGDGMMVGHNVYFFHGLANQDGVKEFQKIKRRGAKFVWSIDDDWTTIPEWNPARPNDDGLACFDLLVDMADWILTSTPYLQQTFKRVKEKVLYAPNMIDVGAFPDCPYVDEKDEFGATRRSYSMSVELPIRVVWVGGPTHREDLTVMTDAVERLLDKYKNKVIVVYQGMQPPSKLMQKYLHRGLFHQPSVPFASYQSVLNSVKPNVYLAPLAPVEFNLSKSNLRVMEGWALFAAPVASDWGEYKCVKSGTDGRLASNPDEWYNGLSRLVTDHEYRLTLAANGRERVEMEYNWSNPECRKPWIDVFTRIGESV